jgi:hypothetical protein
VAAHLAKVGGPEKEGTRPQRMRVVVYGGRGWVGLQVQRLLQAQAFLIYLNMFLINFKYILINYF